MLTFDWRFGPAITESVDGLTDVITEIHWMCLGTDTDTGAVYKTSGQTPVRSADAANFVPFASMSSQHVANLVFTELDRTEVENLLIVESQAAPTRSVKGFNFP